MQRLLNFIFQNQAFFIFLVLETLCVWMVIQNNSYQSASFFNSSNRLAASILSASQDVTDYLSLRKLNGQLAMENAMLRSALEQRNDNQLENSLSSNRDSTHSRFDFVSAKVVSNSVDQFRNHFTINRGSDAGISPGMAVISPAGVAGKVKAVSKKFAVVISMLNLDEHVSATIKRTGHFGTAKWDGVDARYVTLMFIPRHVGPVKGDTVLTSGLNAVFPSGIPVGIIREVTLKENALFYDIKVELSQDFRKLSYVDVVISNFKAEQDSLERTVTNEQP